MDKRGNLKRNILVITVAIAVILVGAYVGISGNNNQETMPQFINITLENSSSLAAYTATNWNDSVKGTSACTVYSAGGAIVANPDHTIGGTVTFWVNISGTPNVATGYGNVSNYTSVSMYYMAASVANLSDVNNGTWITMNGGGNGTNMTLYDPNGNQAAGNKDADSGKSCGNSPEAGGGHTCAIVSSSHFTTGSANTNYTRLFYKTWDTTQIDGDAGVGALSNNSARCVWIRLIAYNGTPNTNSEAQWNGTDADNQGIWVDIDNKVPEVHFNETDMGCNNAAYKCNISDEDTDGAGAIELNANFTVNLNHTGINDTLFGAGNLNEVWIKIQTAQSTLATGSDNLTIYPGNGTDGGSPSLWDDTVDIIANNSWLTPGKHWVWWCANDTVNNVNCSKGMNPMYFLRVNATQLEEATEADAYNYKLNLSHFNGTPETVGSNGGFGNAMYHYRNNHYGTNATAQSVLNITANNGNVRPYFSGRAAGGSFNYELYNFTYSFDDYGEEVDLLGLKLNSSLVNHLYLLNNTNITEGLDYIADAVVTNSSDEAGDINSYWVNIPFLPGTDEEQRNYFVIGKVVFNTTYDLRFNCSVPNNVWTCTEMYECNATPMLFTNYTAGAIVAGTSDWLNNTGQSAGESSTLLQNTSCFIESGTETHIYTSHFSGFAVGNDVTGPTGELKISDNTISSTGSSSITCTAYDHYGVTDISIVINGVEKKKCEDPVNVDTCSYVYAPESTGNKPVTCSATDLHGVKTVREDTIVVTTQTSGPGGGGGATPSKTVSTNLKAGEEKTLTIGEDIGIDSIDLKTIAAAKDVKLTTSALTAKPASANSLTTEKVYKYVEIKTENLEATNIDTATINFKVSNMWINEKGLDGEKVSLYRYVDNKWVELTTQVDKEDATNTYYKAGTPGFSYFVIAEAGAGTQAGTATVVTEPKSTTEWVWWIVGGLVVLGAGALVYFYLLNKKG